MHMHTLYGTRMETLTAEEMDELRRRWYWFLAVGIGLITLGTFAISWAAVTTVSLIIVLGWVLVISGILLMVHTLTRRSQTGFFANLLSGILYLLVGLLILGNPGITAVTLTILISMFLILSGAFITVYAAVTPLPNRGWALLQGIVSFFLGLSIYSSWPVSGLWVIGVFVGIEIILDGLALFSFGLAVRKLPSITRP